MPRDASAPEHVARQYRDGSRLAARIDLHTTFGVAEQPFMRWLFDRERPGHGALRVDRDVGLFTAASGRNRLSGLPGG